MLELRDDVIRLAPYELVVNKWDKLSQHIRLEQTFTVPHGGMG